MTFMQKSDSEFIAALRLAPVGKAAVADAEAKVIAARKKLIAERDALDAKALEEFPKLDKAIQVAIENFEDAKRALLRADQLLKGASYAKSGASVAYDARRHAMERELADTAAAGPIDAFLAEMAHLIEAALKQHEGGHVTERRPLARDPHQRAILHGYSNAASVNARIAAIRAAITAAEALRFAADQSDVAARLAALAAGFPAVVKPILPLIEGDAS